MLLSTLQMNMTLSFLAPIIVAIISFMPMQRYQVGSESTMQISGGSSMHDWSCDVVTNGTMESGDSGLPTRVELLVPVEEIECGKGIMNRKLRKALDADKHPNITFVLDESKAREGDQLKAMGVITVAGKAMSISTVLDVTQLADGQLKYSGSVDMLMTYFGIKPPTAMLGVMKTKDAITISFELVMEATD